MKAASTFKSYGIEGSVLWNFTYLCAKFDLKVKSKISSLPGSTAMILQGASTPPDVREVLSEPISEALQKLKPSDPAEIKRQDAGVHQDQAGA